MKNNEILVLAEQNYGKIHPVTYELIGKGSELAAKTGGFVSCLLVGPSGIPCEELCYRGASPVYYMEAHCFENADEMLFKENIVSALKDIRPQMVLIGATTFGEYRKYIEKDSASPVLSTPVSRQTAQTFRLMKTEGSSRSVPPSVITSLLISKQLPILRWQPSVIRSSTKRIAILPDL